MPIDEECLTIPKAAERIAPDLGLSPYTVGAYLRQAIAKGEISAFQKGSLERVFLKVSDVEEYKRKRSTYTPFTPLQKSG